MSGVSSTIVGGIQDISALLPLVGTEQCEEHVGSALDKGYLYVCISPISIFGSLGIVRAAFNIFLATLNIEWLNFIGAKKLHDGGFELKGSVKEMIALDPAYPTRFLAESRLESMLEEEYIENLDNLAVSWNEDNLFWNFKLALFTVLSAPLGLTPYLYIILKLQNDSDDPLFLSGWGFPIMRLFGSSMCAIVAQILIQMRILVIIKMRLLFLSIDRVAQKAHINLESEPYNLSWNTHSTSETCLWELERWLRTHQLDDYEKNVDLKCLQAHFLNERTRQFPPHFHLTRYSTNVILHLLVVAGIVLSILGYVGCFNLVQNASQNSAGPAIWLGLEIALSVLRIIVWMFNPEWDDSQWGINFKLKPASHPPLITCYKPQSDIEMNGMDISIRVDNYLEEILAYTGPLNRFRWKDVTIQYILAPADGSSSALNTAQHAILYMIISYKEQSYWVLFKSSQTPRDFKLFVSSRIEAPGRTMVRMHGNARVGAHNLTANSKFIEKLQNHYNYVIRQMRRERSVGENVDFHKTWSMQDTESSDKLEVDHNLAHDDVIKLTPQDLAYARQEQLQKRWLDMLGRLDEWITLYIALYRDELIQDLSIYAKDVVRAGLPTEDRSVDFVKKHEADEVEYLLIECQTQMELLLISISTKWSHFVHEQHRGMLEHILTTMFPLDSEESHAQLNTVLPIGEIQQIEANTRYQKLRNRLYDEWQKTLAETTTMRMENKHRRLDEQTGITAKRIGSRKYKDSAADDIMEVWKGGLGLLDESSMILKQLASASATGNMTAANGVRDVASEYRMQIERPFNEALEERYQRVLDENPLLDDETRASFSLMMKRCRNRAELLFSRLENQWNEFHELDNVNFLVDDSHFEKRAYWSHEALRERRRLMDRSQKYLSISETSIQSLGGFQNMIRALSRSQSFVIVDFTHVSSPGLTIDIIIQLLRDVRSITSVVSPKGYPDKLLEAIGSNIDLAIKQQQDMCHYWDITVTAGHSGVSKPYMVFQKPGVSTCQVEFFVYNNNTDHIITLIHLISPTGKLDIALNGHLLECPYGTWGQFGDFKNEDVLLPSAYLNFRQRNSLEIVLSAMSGSEGNYWLLDIALPVRVVHDVTTSNIAFTFPTV